MKILCGDIGGTKTTLALFEVRDEQFEKLKEETFSSREYSGLEEMVRRFRSSLNISLDRASFGIAGPVKNGRSEATNLPWVIDVSKLSPELGVDSVALINDLEANAYGIRALHPDEFFVLNQGNPEVSGNAALISAGTGLGEAGLFWDGFRHRPFPSEGGHTDFSPQTEIGISLLRYLQDHFGHVSWERVLSGPGLVNLYQFLLHYYKMEEPAWYTEETQNTDSATVISKAGLEGHCTICAEALDLWVEFYGAETGNLALKMMTTGGVYIGGGIAPKILEKLKEPGFMRSFSAKGRFQPFLEEIPVKVILNEGTALLGALQYVTLDMNGSQYI